MNVLDIILYSVIFLTAIVFMRGGAVQNLLTIFFLVFATWTSLHYYPEVSELFQGYLDSALLRDLSGGAIIFLLLLSVGFLLARATARLSRMLGLRYLDHLLGFGLGAVAGMVLLWLGIASASLLPIKPPLNERDWWRESQAVVLLFDYGNRVLYKMSTVGAKATLDDDAAPAKPPQAPAANKDASTDAIDSAATENKP